MIELGPLEERLALFAEGIAGRYFHIRPVGEFAGRRVTLDEDDTALTADTLYLPERLPVASPGAYRVLALQQLCRREFGSYRFTLASAVERLPELIPPDNRDDVSRLLGTRASDFERFYQRFPHPGLMSRLFQLCERLRVDVLMVQRYPGIRRHLNDWYRHLLAEQPPEPMVDLLTVLRGLDCFGHGAEREALLEDDYTGALAPALVLLEALRADPGDVYDAAATAARLYELLAPLAPRDRIDLLLPLPEEDSDPSHWAQREARLDDWREQLAALDATLSVDEFADDEAEAGEADKLANGDLRPPDMDLRQAQQERDTLARRIDMERSAIRDAVGPSRPDARSFRYDEWDYLNRRYLPRWCRLFEQRLEPDHTADLGALEATIRAHRPGVQKRLEHIKPLGYQRVYRLADGDELDFNAVIQARQDIRAGHSPDERVYSRRERVHRDVCAVFLVDLSASTDDPVDPPPPSPSDPEDDFLWGRGPWERPAAPVGALSGRDPTDGDRGRRPLPQQEEEREAHPAPAEAAEPRRIIDVQRDAMLAMSAALEQLGDSYGIYGFSGYGRDCIEVFVAKEPEERFSRATLAAIAAMRPKRSTRMGPAIRHAVQKLIASGNAMKVLLIISDGFPQDCDYGPERGEHEYGVQDTARALQEAHDKGVETFCVTVDRSGHDYLKRMCPDSRYLVIEEVEDLPEQLSKVYETLTA